MPGHDIIVIGASAGGLKALGAIVAKLPAGMNASIFIVQHLPADKPSMLPQILEDLGSLPVTHPTDGAKFKKGHIYVAPPDHHLLIARGSVRVVRGPQENRFRPAIDALFRSAARTYGPRVIAVVLTGYLDDGTVGLQAVKKRGGTAIVQSPEEAEYPSMPRNAMRYVTIDHCAPLAEIPDLLIRIADEPAADEATYPLPQDIEVESRIAEQQLNTKEFLDKVEAIGSRTTYACPQCNGSIWRIGEEDPIRFRCHVGHSLTADAFLAAQGQNLENVLWSAVKMMEEKVTLLRQLAERLKDPKGGDASDRYERYAAKLDKEVTVVRDLILHGFATKQSLPVEDAAYQPHA